MHYRQVRGLSNNRDMAKNTIDASHCSDVSNVQLHED